MTAGATSPEVVVLVRARAGGAALDEVLQAARAQQCDLRFEVLTLAADASLDAALEQQGAPLVALLEEGAPPEPGWLQALLAPLREDAEVAAVAGALGRAGSGPARFSAASEQQWAALQPRLREACRLPLASAALRREAWDELRFPAGPDAGARFAQRLLGAGWAKCDAPAAVVRWAGPLPPPAELAPGSASPSPAHERRLPGAAALTRAAKLLRSASRAAEVLRDGGPRGVLQRLRERARPEVPWHEQLPWSALAQPHLQPAPPRASALEQPLLVNWVVPAFYPGSGGHMTIFRLVRQLEQLGHRCRVVFTSTEGLLPREGVRLRELVQRHFQPLQARCVAWSGQPLPDADVHVATHWDTAHLVARRRRAGAGAYLVQDWEPSFYPAGTRAAVAEQTYSLGLMHLAAGPWLAERLRERGAEALPFELAVDPAEYFVEAAEGAPGGRIAVYLRPLTARRGFEIVCLALAEVQRQRPEVEICVYGAPPSELQLPFRATLLGVLETRALRRLYCSSTAGLSCSLTNHSLVPQEMWACGLPVVEVDAESTRAVYRDGQDALLAPFEPQGMAARLLQLLDSAELRQRLRESGLLRAQQLSWEKSGRQIEAGLRRAVARALEQKEAR